MTIATGKNPFPWAAGYDYSQSAVVDGRLVFASGQGGFGDDGQVVDADNFEAQVRRAYSNLAAVLEAEGASLAGVVKMTVYLLRQEDYEAFKQVRREFFSPPYPASTVILAGGFVFPGMLVELDAVAVVGEARETTEERVRRQLEQFSWESSEGLTREDPPGRAQGWVG